MTAKTINKRKDSGMGALGIIIFFIIALILLLYGNESKEAVIFGIKLSALSIIPAIFPFFILSDLLLVSFTNSGGFARRLFERIFHISGSALPTFIIGLVCGFPLGVKGACELYKDKRISKEECERLSGFVNNPSLAFVISGVGLGMLGSIKHGVMLYFSVMLASIMTGYMFRIKRYKTHISEYNTKQKFNLTLSIKNAGQSSLLVSSYIIFFSMILGILSAVVKSSTLVSLLSPIFEVGNATKLLSANTAFSPVLTFSLIAFALGFSGLSVFMQAASFLPPGISRKKILLMKITEGIISALIAFVIYLL